MTAQIKAGDIITFKPEWSDSGDDEFVFVAIENEDGGRVKVSADLGLTFNPVDVIRVEWIATVNGTEYSHS